MKHLEVSGAVRPLYSSLGAKRLIIVTPMKILQRNLNRSTFVVWEMKRCVSVVCVCNHCNIVISGKIIKKNVGFGSEWDTLYKLHCANWATLKHVLNMQDCCTIFHAIAIRSEGRQTASSIWPVDRYKAHESKLPDSILLNHVTLN